MPPSRIPKPRIPKPYNPMATPEHKPYLQLLCASQQPRIACTEDRNTLRKVYPCSQLKPQTLNNPVINLASLSASTTLYNRLSFSPKPKTLNNPVSLPTSINAASAQVVWRRRRTTSKPWPSAGRTPAAWMEWRWTWRPKRPWLRKLLGLLGIRTSCPQRSYLILRLCATPNLQSHVGFILLGQKALLNVRKAMTRRSGASESEELLFSVSGLGVI